MAAYQSEMKHNLDSLRLVIALFFFLRFGGCLHGHTAANHKSILYCCNHIIISIITSTLQSGALNSAV